MAISVPVRGSMVPPRPSTDPASMLPDRHVRPSGASGTTSPTSSLLVFGKDPVRAVDAQARGVLQQIVAVHSAASGAQLDQPGPDVRGRCVDGDGTGALHPGRWHESHRPEAGRRPPGWWPPSAAAGAGRPGRSRRRPLPRPGPPAVRGAGGMQGTGSSAAHAAGLARSSSPTTRTGQWAWAAQAPLTEPMICARKPPRPAPADHQQLGVPALLHQDLGRRAELHGPGQSCRARRRRRHGPGTRRRAVRPSLRARWWWGCSPRAGGRPGRWSEVPRQVTTSNGALRLLAMRPASRSAVVEKSEPSTPTTIR